MFLSKNLNYIHSNPIRDMCLPAGQAGKLADLAIRIFTKLRELGLTHKDILLQLERLDRKVAGQDDDIKLIFDYLQELLNPPTEPMRKIGFKIKGAGD